MKLAYLPPEVLALILDGEFSWAAVELWKTRDRALMARLKNRGIKEVLLTQVSTKIALTWPRCLKEFQLKTLCLASGSQPLLLPALRAELLRQHTGVESLSLDFPGAINLFLNESTPSGDPTAPQIMTSSYETEPTFKRSKVASTDSDARFSDL